MEKKELREKVLEVFSLEELHDFVFDKKVKEVLDEPVELCNLPSNCMFFISEHDYDNILKGKDIAPKVLFIDYDEEMSSGITDVLYDNNFIQVEIEEFDKIKHIVRTFDYCFEKELDDIESIHDFRKSVSDVLFDNEIAIVVINNVYYTISKI